MPTFTAIALDRLIEPGPSRSVNNSGPNSKPPIPNPKPIPSTKMKRSSSTSVTSKVNRPQISPALYATPEATPLPDSPSSFPPSPYIINHKRRGPRLLKSFSEDNVSSWEKKAHEEDEVNGNAKLAEGNSVDLLKDCSVTFSIHEPNEEEHENGAHNGPINVERANSVRGSSIKEEHMNGFHDGEVGSSQMNNGLAIDASVLKPRALNLEKGGDSEDFFDPNESMSVASNTEGGDDAAAESAARFATQGVEFFDAWDELSSESLPQSGPHDIEAELREIRHLSSNTSYLTSHPVERSSSVDITGQSSNAMSRDWSHLRMSPSHGRIPAADSNVFNHETNRFLGGSSATNASVEVGGLQHNFISGRNPVLPQGFHGNSAQSVRGARTNYLQRSSPNFRASSSSVHIGHAASYEEGMQVVSESYPTRHHRPLSAVTWRNNERSGRSRISNDRYQSLADDAAFHSRFSSEGFMIVDRSAFYGSRNMFDQHRDMRLDIDNMTYEELLALGERIGSVNTGLSEDSISKCLAETIYSSSDQFQDESSCVICLEEYKDMDEVGALKTCGHKYHVPCIKKWLSMKNTCPICKASAVADDIK